MPFTGLRRHFCNPEYRCSTLHLKASKRTAGGKKHFEFVVAIHLVFSVFIRRRQQNVHRFVQFGLSPCQCQYDSSKFHPVISIHKEASSWKKWRLSLNLISDGKVMDLKRRSNYSKTARKLTVCYWRWKPKFIYTSVRSLVRRLTLTFCL